MDHILAGQTVCTGNLGITGLAAAQRPALRQQIRPCDAADASISDAVSRRRDQLEKALGGSVPAAARDMVLDRLMEVYAGELAEKAVSRGAAAQLQESFKFRLDRDNYAFREQWLDSADAAQYYGGRFSRYLRAVLEEYAAKTVYRREEIYFSRQLRLIRDSAANGELLCIQLKSGSRFDVRPYGVFPDRQETYHYLVGISCLDGLRASERVSSFRLSNLEKIRVSSKRSGRLTGRERTDIENSIRGKGIQFLVQQEETIRIRLTEQGWQDYQRQMHLRPAAVRKEAICDGAYYWEYTFSCTEFQAEVYFLKFCGDAKVMAPQSLRKKFADRYLSGWNAYSPPDPQSGVEEP